MHDDALVDALKADPETAPLGTRSRAFVTYAVKLTRTPHGVTAEDLAPLRAAGLTDRGIHDLAAVGASFNFVHRIAEGLGVALEEEP
ncbi:MAG: peroxidase [Gemmatimonadaceae bacterium]|nr:peroxidase [Gemmatimonadaceae bacterium]